MEYSGEEEFLWSLNAQVKDQRAITITFLVPYILSAVPQALYCGWDHPKFQHKPHQPQARSHL